MTNQQQPQPTTPASPTPSSDLVDLVRRMRTAQKKYFRDRTPSLLTEARDYERRVDKVLADLAAPPQPSLWGGR